MYMYVYIKIYGWDSLTNVKYPYSSNKRVKYKEYLWNSPIMFYGCKIWYLILKGVCMWHSI